MAEITNMGILTNTPNIYDATSRRIPENTELIFDDKYQGGEAISSTKPGVTIFDTGVIKAGTFAGTYSIGFYYDSSTATVQGTPLMRFEVYEDGVLMPEDTSVYANGTIYEYDLNFFNYSYLYGLHDNKVLKANSTYRVVVKTSDSLTNDVILDYVTFSRHGDNGIINTNPEQQKASLRNGGRTTDISTNGTQMVFEEIKGTLSGSFSAGETANYGYTYNTKFKTILGAHPTILDGNGQMLLNWSDVNYINNQVLIYIKNISSSTWTKAVSDANAWNYGNLRVMVVGYI